MAVELDTSYQVAAGEVKLTITIGNAQLGDSIVKLENKVLGMGDIVNLVVGKGPAITGKALRVKSVVTDVSDKTNMTSIAYLLTGGAAPGTYDLNAEVAQEGDSIIYRAAFHFE